MVSDGVTAQMRSEGEHRHSRAPATGKHACPGRRKVGGREIGTPGPAGVAGMGHSSHQNAIFLHLTRFFLAKWRLITGKEGDYDAECDGCVV